MATMENTNTFVVYDGSDYYILSYEEVLIAISRGKNKYKLNLCEFSKPLDEISALTFTQETGFRPFMFDSEANRSPDFWELMEDAVNIANDVDFVN